MQPFIAPKPRINKEELIRLAKEQAAQSKANAGAPRSNDPNSTELARKASLIKPEEAADKLRIIFDNSSSMDGKKLEDAKEGVVEFLKNCNPNSTAIAMHLLNANYDEYLSLWSDAEERGISKIPTLIKSATLSSDLILYASEITEPSVQAWGGTPLFSKISEALDATPLATRLVAFSDGAPTDNHMKLDAISKAKTLKIPIDTIYIADGYVDQDALQIMQYIAEATGGIFLDLTKSSIKGGLKYLAPSKRLLLADKSFKAQVERGEA